MFDLGDKIAVVTGGSRGLGREIAFAYAHHGATVVIASRKQEACAATAREIMSATGRKAVGIACHVGHWEQCDALVDRVYGELGRVDVLVNNAAYFSSIVKKPFEEITVGEWDKAFAINVRGAWLCARAVSPIMKSQGWGRIINTSSMTFHGGGIDGFAHYASTKAAIVGLTRSLAKELGKHGIVVNTISPDYVEHEGELFQRQPEMAGILAQQRAIQRPGTMDDLIGPVLFLASDAVGFITGQDIWVNGGRIFG